MLMLFRFWGLAVTVLVLDQWTKYLAENYLPAHRSVPLFAGVLSLTYVRNPGTAFGLLHGSGHYLVGIGIVAVLFIVAYWNYLGRQGRRPNAWLICGLALPLGGALGNLSDRLWSGQVVDFVDFHWWPVFNVADSAISVGAALVAYYFFFLHERAMPEAAPLPVEQPAD